jgi:hypothetical protein
MDDHIAKPIRATELVTKVSQWIGGSHAGAGLDAAVNAA